eukprot:SAG31_NODE_2154_length_6312_cov_3.684050_6_plen_100_part_00
MICRGGHYGTDGVACFVPFRPRDVRTWDVSVVEKWLKQLNYKADIARARGIDGRALIFMSASSLAKMLCSNVAQHKPFKHALKYLRTEVIGIPLDQQPV